MAFMGGAFRRWTYNDKRVWKRKQKAAAPGRYYGGMGTIHGTTHLDVMVDKQGTVRAVWFRCQKLAFEQHETDGIVGEGQGDKVTGVEVER